MLLPAAKAAYVPNLRPTPKLLTRSTPHVQSQDPRNKNVVLAKYLLVDGSITFAIGFRSEGTVNQGSQEIPFEQILNHVTPRELERFETTEFIKEDEQEEEYLRLAALRKPKGRPVGWRAEMGLTYAEFVEMNGGVLQSSETENVHQRPGKSSKSYQTSPVAHTFFFSAPSGPKVASLRRRGRPRVYSMVVAAGLGFESGDQDETSRDITPIPVVNNASGAVGGPPSKKRRTVDRAAPRSKQFSPGVILDSEAGAATNVSKPMVVVSSQGEPRPHSTSPDQRSAPLTWRRCRRCNSRRQGYSGDKPCRCCTNAGIGPDGCISEDEVQPRTPRRTQNGAATHDSSQIFRGTKLSRQLPSLGSSNFSSSESDDGLEIGSTIVVEDVRQTKGPSNYSSSESDDDSEIRSTIVVEDVTPRLKSPELEPSLEIRSSRVEKSSSAPVARPLSSKKVPFYPTLTAPLAKTRHSSPPRSFDLEVDLDHEQAGRSKHPVATNVLDSNLLLSERKRPSGSSQSFSDRLSSTNVSDSFSPIPNYFSPFHTIQKYFTKGPTSTGSVMSSIGATATNTQPTLQAQNEAASKGIKLPPKPQALSDSINFHPTT